MDKLIDKYKEEIANCNAIIYDSTEDEDMINYALRDKSMYLGFLRDLINARREKNEEREQKDCNISNVMPRLICHYNERESGYLTIGETYQAIGKNEDGFEIIDDSGDCNTYSTAYLNEA